MSPHGVQISDKSFHYHSIILLFCGASIVLRTKYLLATKLDMESIIKVQTTGKEVMIQKIGREETKLLAHLKKCPDLICM